MPISNPLPALSSSASQALKNATEYTAAIKSLSRMDGLSPVAATAVVNQRRPDLHKAWYAAKVAEQNRRR
ncbi:MAG: hypothetical protein JSS51_01400 [Planctomycetes bacterium]|nr:hypothetical protein [Planctomycetota bacterium]